MYSKTANEAKMSGYLGAFGLMIAALAPSTEPVPVDEAVRWDWQFRESLAAIRDWETILEHWQAPVTGSRLTPIVPVPTNGAAVVWLNPIPKPFLPPVDIGRQVRLRVVDGKVEIERSSSGKLVERERVDFGKVIQGYQHPGGGGKDRWYHRYERRFDCLTRFQCQPAPFSLQIESPIDWPAGVNELVVSLENVERQPLEVTACWSWLPGRTPSTLSKAVPREKAPADGSRPFEQQESKTIILSPGAVQQVRFPCVLTRPGGGLGWLTLEAAGKTYWLPILTHVEDVAAVLQSIEQIAADTPNAAAARQCARLRQQVSQGPSAVGTRWRVLFEEASALRDRLLLARVTADRLLFVKRKPFSSEQPFMDAHHCYNPPGGGIYCLAPVGPTGRVTPVVDSLGRGIYRDLCLHWDAKRLLFAFGNGSDRPPPELDNPTAGQSYHLFEVGTDGEGLRQLTRGPKNDCEGFYLPNGQIGFTSDRPEHYVMCGANIHVASLFTMDADGSDVRQLGFNVFNEFNPALLPDGRIIYNRWEYNERSVTSLHNLFTIHPDGTHVAPYYGNATIRPNVIMFPRSVPGSSKVMALFTAHHGQTHGPIGLIDVNRGVDGPAPITLLTPHVPVTGEKTQDSRWGWFSDPRPLSETTWLCSFTPTVRPWVERGWALYVGDRHGNLALVYRDPDISCAEPVPLLRQPRPAVLPPATAGAAGDSQEASLLMIDVHQGLEEVPRNAARHLRIIEDVPRKGVPEGGVICTAGTSIYTVKRVLGTVPVERDGSAHFVVPTNRNIYFEVLDQDRREIQRMRSVLCLKPGEHRTCVGCHEPRTVAPPNRTASAFQRVPSRPVPPSWGTQTVSFLRDVQPVLNARCIRCHTHDRAAQGVVLTDDLTDQFTVGYEELLPYLSVANAMRWDHADDVYARPAYTYGSNASPLIKLLAQGHHDVRLSDDEWHRLTCWIDTNAVYYDRYETYYPNRHLFAGPLGAQLQAVYARRCAGCHGEKADGRHGTWWLSLNRHDPKQSRAIQAPLARLAGGWQRCSETVFASTADPDYQSIFAMLNGLATLLAERPRADLRSLRGTPAASQKVELPAPPPPRSSPMPDRPADQWVQLSEMPWLFAHSGWTPNRDGLPRRDRDITDQTLRLGPRSHRKGLGTHAPSEIMYRLDGKFHRFAALIGAAEKGGTVVFQVFGDQKLLYQSSVLRGLRQVEQVDVSVEGIQQLRLIVTDANDGYHCDMANWVDARLR